MKRVTLIALMVVVMVMPALANDSTYLNFTAVNGAATIRLSSGYSSYPVSLQYSTDSVTWNAYTLGSTINLASGQKVYFKADSTNGAFYSHQFYMTGVVSADGNIMSLLDATMTMDSVPDYAFYQLFYQCNSLIKAPALPATTLASGCYSYMFGVCSSLTQAPALPATTLADHCYSNMFYYCTSLTQTPALPATTLADSCYSWMFLGCTSLTQAPALPATTLASGCYSYMFGVCSSLTQAPALPATTLANCCYSRMFDSCTSLTQAPTLPATTLCDSCYFHMFDSCTSLTQTPALPATTLANGCYSGMFDGCTSLLQAPALPATTLANSCYSYMFYGCTSLTQAPALPATTLTYYCYSSMFNRCTSLTQAPTLPATTLADNCYDGMFAVCTSLTQAPTLPATTLARGCYFGMFDGCTSLTQAPALPATSLAEHCYNSMFYGCTSLTQTPALPATTLVYGCYAGMFGGCTSLRQISALPADTLEDYCCYNMFSGCDSLIVNVQAPGAQWMIPASNTAYGSINNMFVGTGGTMNGTPSLNTVYYLPNGKITSKLVNANANDTAMGKVTGRGYYEAGDSVIIVAKPKVHCHFVYWSNGATSDTIMLVVNGDTTLTANFAFDQHSVTVSSNDTAKGVVSGGGLYDYRDTVTLVATAYSHYHLVNWSNGATSDTIMLVVNSDTTLTANFAFDQHTVKVSSNDTAKGVVSGGGLYDYGDTVTLVATAYSHCHFVNWSNDATSDTIMLVVNGDTTLTANFAIDQHTVTVNSNDTTKGIVSGGGLYDYGDTVTLVATANVNYRFVSWSNGAMNDTITLFVSGDTTLTANFTVDYGHNIIVNSNDSSADVYFYFQENYDTTLVTGYHLVMYRVGGNDTADVYFSRDTSFVMQRIPRVIVIVDSVSGTTTTVTISINHAAFNPDINEVNVHLEGLAPNSTYSLTLEALGSMGEILDYDSCSLTTALPSSVSEVYEDEETDDFFPTEQTDVYTIDGRYVGKYHLDLPPGIYLMRENGKWHKFGKSR